MCSALAALGHQVTLISKLCPSRQEPGVVDDHAFYGVPPAFEVVKLPRPAFSGGGLLWTLGLRTYLSSAGGGFDLVISRDLWGAALAERRGLPLVFEAHGRADGFWARRVFATICRSPSCRRLVVISEALARIYRESGLLPEGLDLLVAHDAGDPLPEPAGDETIPPSLADPNRLHAGYVGHLYPGRGVELILALARRQQDCAFHLVGGAESDLAAWRRRDTPPNLILHGFVPPGHLAAYYRRFDLLLMPYERRVITAGRQTDTATWMSPLKLFEYMAAGKPIVSSDLPVLREVLRDGENALLAPPGDEAAWERAFERLCRDPLLRQRLGERARGDLLERYTWEARARRILHGL